MTNVRSKSTDEPFVRLCSNSNSISSNPLWYSVLPQNHPRDQRKLLTQLKWLFFWFYLQSRPCGVPDTSAVTQEVHCLFGIHTIYLPFSHCVSPWQPAEWARKSLWNHRGLDRGVLPARKRLSECRSMQFYLMKEALRGYTPCWWYLQD